jgi:hypothetical protein
LGRELSNDTSECEFLDVMTAKPQHCVQPQRFGRVL